MKRTPRWVAGWTPQRLGVMTVAGGVGAGVGYAASWILAVATCPNGGCPTATEPLPLIVLLAVVAAWAAGKGAST